MIDMMTTNVDKLISKVNKSNRIWCTINQLIAYLKAEDVIHNIGKSEIARAILDDLRYEGFHDSEISETFSMHKYDMRNIPEPDLVAEIKLVLENDISSEEQPSGFL